MLKRAPLQGRTSRVAAPDEAEAAALDARVDGEPNTARRRFPDVAVRFSRQ